MTRSIAGSLLLAASLAGGCRHRAPPPHAPPTLAVATAVAPDAPDAPDAPASDAVAAVATTPAAPAFAREARGTLRLASVDATRCETGDGVVALFDGPALFTVTAAERVEGLRAWARGHGRVMVVLETEGSDEAVPSCVEAETEGGAAVIELPAGAWSLARVYVASRMGSTSPFVAGVTNAAEVPATEPAPLPAVAPDEVRARWLFTAQTPCSELECPALALELTGALERTLTAPSDLNSVSCRTVADYAHPGAIGFGCSAAGFDTVTLRSGRPRGRYEVTFEHESHGACGGPCPRSRTVMHRFSVAPALRLVAHPAGVFRW